MHICFLGSPTNFPSSSVPSISPSSTLPTTFPSRNPSTTTPSFFPTKSPITYCVNHQMCNTTSYCSRQGKCHHPLSDCCLQVYGPYRDLKCPQSSGCLSSFEIIDYANLAFKISINILLAFVCILSAYLILRLCMKCYRAARRAEDDGSIADVELLNNDYEQMYHKFLYQLFPEVRGKLENSEYEGF